jgi:uncharacterized protein
MDSANRRDFLRTAATVGAGLALGGGQLLAAGKKKSVLLFTKSSGFEHDVIKTPNGQPSTVEKVLRDLGQKHGFDVVATKDGGVFSSNEFREHSALFFFTTGDLTQVGTDKNPPMTAAGKQALLDSIHDGQGFIGTHAATDTFHSGPDTEDRSDRYQSFGEKSDPYIRMIGAEFINHGRAHRLQTQPLVVNDPTFPGLQGVKSPVSFKEEWYSMKDFREDLHVILTLDTKGMLDEIYQRAPYPVTWTRMHGKGRVFYCAIGDLQESWSNPFFLKLLGGGVRYAIGDVSAKTDQNLKTAAPGYADMPPPFPPEKK